MFAVAYRNRILIGQDAEHLRCIIIVYSTGSNPVLYPRRLMGNEREYRYG